MCDRRFCVGALTLIALGIFVLVMRTTPYAIDFMSWKACSDGACTVQGWLGALSGWAAAIAALVTVWTMRSQLREQRASNNIAMGEIPPHVSVKSQNFQIEGSEQYFIGAAIEIRNRAADPIQVTRVFVEAITGNLTLKFENLVVLNGDASIHLYGGYTDFSMDGAVMNLEKDHFIRMECILYKNDARISTKERELVGNQLYRLKGEIDYAPLHQSKMPQPIFIDRQIRF